MRLPAIAYFAIGGFAMFFGLFFVVFLRDVPELLYLCGPVTIIPGTIAIVLGVMQWRREQVVIEFANWAKSQRRIKMDVMAQRIGKTRFETEKLLGEALDDGLVKGVIDRSADEFVVQDRGAVLCSSTGIVPGLLVLLLGLRAREEEKTLVACSAWIKTYRRIPLNDLAKNMGKTRFETEQVLAAAVERRLVEGIVDRTTDEFVVKESIGQQIFVDQCPHCGAAIHRWFLPEDRLICSHCNQPILAYAAASTKSGSS